MRNLDGILLPVSVSDVNPLRYGREPHPRLGNVHQIKDETDLLVLEQIEKRAMPLFAICFGIQILNVSRGGTLIQDIAAQWPNAIKHDQGVPRDRASHRVRIISDSIIGRLVDADSVSVNSHHHQAIETAGRELIATAWAADGLIEAVEDLRTERFVLGVQWHPELGWQKDPFARGLFERFVAEARQFAEKGETEQLTVA